MANGDIYQLTVVSEVNNEPIANVFYVEAVDETGTTDPLGDAFNAFVNQVLTKFVEAQSNQVVYDAAIVRRVYPTTSPSEVKQITEAGDSVIPAMPANQAVVIRHYSGVGDKRRRGRYFQAGIPESYFDDGRVKETYDGQWDNLKTALTGVVVDSGRDYRVKHYSPTNNAYYDIDSVIIDPTPTKLRKRTPGLTALG